MNGPIRVSEQPRVPFSPLDGGMSPERRPRMKNLKHSLAHVRRNEDESFEIHHLEEHLRAVADLAGEFALKLEEI